MPDFQKCGGLLEARKMAQGIEIEDLVQSLARLIGLILQAERSGQDLVGSDVISIVSEGTVEILLREIEFALREINAAQLAVSR